MAPDESHSGLTSALHMHTGTHWGMGGSVGGTWGGVSGSVGGAWGVSGSVGGVGVWVGLGWG